MSAVRVVQLAVAFKTGKVGFLSHPIVMGGHGPGGSTL